MHLKIAVLALLVVPLAAGQIEMTDPAGDQVLHVSGQAIPDPAGVYAQTDLLGLNVDERDRSIVFELQTSAIGDDRFLATINFTYGDSPYWLTIDHDGIASLFKLHEWRAPRTFDAALDGVMRTFEIPKSDLTDASGTTGNLGTELRVHDVQAVRDHSIAGEGLVTDSMDGGGALVLKLGASPAKDVRLSSPQPTRVSNGAATVYAYELVVSNLLDQEVIVQLTARDLPPDWQVSFPAQIVHLDANERREIQALVAVPFRHQHGSFQSAWIEARHWGEEDLLSDIELGVRFTEIPQLAGHHAQVWFHSTQGQSPSPHGPMFFSTLEDHPLSDGNSYRPGCTGGTSGFTYLWKARMDAVQSIGLDFDLSRPIELSVPIETSIALADLTAEVQLWIGEYRVARFDEAIEDLPSGQTTLTFTMPIVESLDELPADASRVIELWLTLDGSSDPASTTCPAIAPLWLPGGVMTLPLFEYHEAIPINVAGILTASDVPSKVAPGSTFQVQYSIEAAPGQAVEARLFGHGIEDTQLIGPATTTDKDGKATLGLSVSVPHDAPEGRVYNLILQVTAGQQIGLHRTVFSVAADGAMLAQTSTNDDGGSHPAPAFPAVLAIAVALLGRRRRAGR